MNLDRTPFRLPWRFVLEFLLDGRTPMRALSDEAVVAFTKLIAAEVPQVIELGSAGNYYKDMLSSIVPVKTSNIVPGCDLVIDMTKMDIAGGTVDALMSMFALEHFFEYSNSFSEASRVLKPNGYYLLIAPFLYYYHAAPDDFFRFSDQALKRLADKYGFDVVQHSAMGDRALLFAEFLHEKKVLGSPYGPVVRFLYRLAALPALLISILRSCPDNRFAMGHALLLRRRTRITGWGCNHAPEA